MNRKWKTKIYLLFISVTIFLQYASGAIIKYKNGFMDSEEMKNNWTQLADEWIQVQGTLEANYVAVLPSSGDIRDLNPAVNYSAMPLDNDQKNDLVRIFGNTVTKLFDVPQVLSAIRGSVKSRVSCSACKIGVGLLQHYIKTGKSDQTILTTIYQFCVTLHIQTARVCDGVIHLMGAELVYVLRRINMTPPQICGFILGNVCDDNYGQQHEWQVTFPPIEKPPVTPPIAPHEGTHTFKVLQISDTHYDPYYQEGSNAECNEPLCCRQTSGTPRNAAAAAGRWGDYRSCDTPKRTIDHMLQHINETHPDIDYILWTGDLPPHDVWNQSREENLNVLRDTVAQMIEKFPGVPIFPALGNHEAVPVNSFAPAWAPKENSISWLYDELDRQWQHWLPAGVSPTVRRGAFYSILARPGFKIISVNMNYCNNINWWLLINSTDPVGELQWLIYELQGAEINGEKVHIIGHIPPGHSDCLKVWSRNYYHIINRYESTITAQFFGHTHFDEFQLFYDIKNLSRALSIAYVGPSVSPYYDLNPGYRIYYVDGDHQKTTRMVVDHESWVMNLEDANLHDNPIWYKMYSARDAYQMNSLLPKDWDTIIEKMTNDATIFDLYFIRYWKDSPNRPKCDKECRKRMLCDLRSGRSDDRKNLCRSIETRIDGLLTGIRREVLGGLGKLKTGIGL